MGHKDGRIRNILHNFVADLTWANPDGGTGGLDPLENHKNIRFLSNTGPDSLKNYKATTPAFNVGPSSHARETPLKWRFAGGPMIARL